MKRLFSIANLAILSLAVISFLFSALPVWQNRGPGVFFEADPDFVYLSNAILYIKSHQIFYLDHPGTPAIRLLALAFTPFRLYAKFIAHELFVIWFIKHPDTVYLFARLFQSLLLGVSVFILLKSIKLLTNSILASIFLWALLLIYGSFLYVGSSISAEGTNLFILSLVIYFLSNFYLNKSPLTLAVLSLVVGLSLANRLTNLFIVFGILALPFSLSKLKRTQQIYNATINSFLLVLGFILGTWSIRRGYPSLFAWVFRLASTSGLHGDGQKSFFSLSSYNQSITILWSQQKWPIIVILLSLMLAILVLLKRKRNQYLPFLIVLVASSLGSMVFAKYSLPHYHLPNYLFIAFIFTFFMNQFAKTFLPIILLFLLINIVPKNLISYYQTIDKAAEQSRALQDFIDTHPPKRATIWEWGRSRDFALLWGRSWTGGFLDQELSQVRPNLWELDYRFDTVKPHYNSPEQTFSACWDQLYIQQLSAPSFLKKFPKENLTYIPIANTTMALITSTHCSKLTIP